MTKQELLDKANDLPLAPGVYLMMDKSGEVIYVGKAKKLKNRVSQYFQEGSSHNEKTRRMVAQVDHFDTIFVSSEFEALILENSLIKQHMPRYNILLKDDKGYPFVRLGTGHYPRFTMVSKPADDDALYFGPFGGRSETRAAIDAICAAFRLPTCSRVFPRDIGKERPCLNHHMGRCDGFCRGTPDEEEYLRRIGQAEELLGGHYRRLTRALREEMEREAEALHFEQAAALRDRVRAIEVLGKRQKVIAGICADTDIWGVYRGALKCGSAVLHIEDGSVTGRDLNLFAAPQDESEQMILSALLPDFPHMEDIVRRSYNGKFPTADLTPLVPVGDKYVLELYHGPTSAFKDVALSVLPRLIGAAAKAEGMAGDVVILTATSGDTGKAALEGFHDVKGTRIIVFYPYGGVSAVQQAQMATQTGDNVKVCAVRGNFDDAQTGVKQVFAACKGRDLHGAMLSSANSINIGRLAPQVVYYFRAYGDLVKAGRIALGDKVNFVVPTGNFGDILAGYLAKRLGLPVGKLICASNANNVLTEFIATGRYDRRRPFYKTTSPSMDILVSSNLERLLYLLSEGDCGYVAGLMEQLNREGHYQVSSRLLERLQAEFDCACCDDAGAAEVIRRLWQEQHYLCDPHTAVAWSAAEQVRLEDGAPVVVLSTASPYKFPAAVLSALGEEPGDDEFAMMDKLSALTGTPIPKNLATLREKQVRHKDVIDKDAMLDYVLGKIQSK